VTAGEVPSNPKDICGSRSLFVIGYNEDEEAISCGAIRPINEGIAEVAFQKHLYTTKVA
jgi:hypothetical protein